jgi:O-antigen/teichoic acid export membrane protein
MSRLLGQHWAGAAGLVPLVALGLALSAVTVGFGPYLRARGLLRYEVWIKTIAAPLTFAAIVAGCLVDGVAGGALGQAVGLLLVAAGLAVKTIRLPAAVPVAAAGATR